MIGEDTNFKSGFIGLFSDDTIGVFFDGFKVFNIDCHKD